MNSIRITNMRSLVDTGNIDLKTINMLVGSNSSGKSTFLRVFPLLKQSFFRRINGPILWAGDDEDYVDFGSYKETINKNAKNNCIGLEFAIPYEIKNIKRQLEGPFSISNSNEKYNINKEAKLTIEISNKNDADIISKIKITCDNEELYIDKEKDVLYLNKKDVKVNNLSKKYRENYGRYSQQNSFFNAMYELFNNREIYNKILTDIFGKNDTINDYLRFYKQEFLDRLIIEMFINNNIEIKEFLEKFKKDLNRKNRLGTKNLDDILNINTNILNNEEIIRNLKVLYISEVGKFCIDYMQAYFMNVNYIKPVRAHAERYYRLRNLSVDQIDSDGRNLPIFINSLGEDKLIEYNKWIYKYFDFKVIPVQTDGHVSINIEKNDKKVNLSDTGYGYSQLLPIITQLWVILNMQIDFVKEAPVVFAIEQPELHLHPQLQAKLIDIISQIAKNKKNKIQFILKTHSKIIINRL